MVGISLLGRSSRPVQWKERYDAIKWKNTEWAAASWKKPAGDSKPVRHFACLHGHAGAGR
jgi:hypothetical protein